MHTLTELNPQVGDTLWEDREKWKVTETAADAVCLSNTRLLKRWVSFGSSSDCIPCWRKELPVSEAPMKTVADLNLKVGDRIRSGGRTGTVCSHWVSSAYHHTDVLWDWEPKITHYTHEKKEVDWQKLPKPEPTLASLGLKVGDPVLLNYAVWLVSEVREADVLFICSTGVTQKYPLSKPLMAFSQVKKLEVPK